MPQNVIIEITLNINMFDEIIKLEKTFYIVSKHQDIGKIHHVGKIIHKQSKKKVNEDDCLD